MSYHLKPKYTSHRLLQNGMRTSTSKWMMMFTLISVSFHKPFSRQEKLYLNSVIIQECLVLHWLATDQNRECTLGAWSLDLSLLKSKQQSLSFDSFLHRSFDSFSLDLRVCRGVKYHEPEYWKFGEEGNKYFRHATGQIYAVSKDLATYISVNRWALSPLILYCQLPKHVRLTHLPQCLIQATTTQVREWRCLFRIMVHWSRCWTHRCQKPLLRNTLR